MAEKSLKEGERSKWLFDPVQVVKRLLGLDALIWAGFGIFSLLSQMERYPEQRTLYTLIALMMFGNAAAMLGAAMLIGKRRRIFYLLTLVLVLVNIFLTFTDQFGVFDLATLILGLMIGVLLISRRGAFLPGEPIRSG